MTKFNKGDQVATVKKIGGVLRPEVPAGTPGVVTSAPAFSSATVLFRIPGGMFSSDRTVSVEVDDNEIR